MLLPMMLLGYLVAYLLISIQDLTRIYRQRKKDNDFLDDYHARVKPVYLELHDYTFFHSPSGIKKPDKRFVGRKYLLKKLETILTRSQTKSGAYLISGFRGMGKTSLVRKVLAKISGQEEGPRLLFSFGFRMILIFTLLALFNWFPDWPNWILWIFGGLVSFACFRLLKGDTERPNLKQYYSQAHKNSLWDILNENLKALFRLFSINRYLQPRTNLEVIFLFFLHISLLLAISRRVLNPFGNELNDGFSYGQQWLVIVSTWFIGAILIFHIKPFLVWMRWWRKDRNQGVEPPPNPLYPIKNLLHFIIQSANSHQRVSVEISFAQDELKEVDVLRILANRMVSKYQKIIRPFSSINRFLWYLGIFLLVYLISGLIYFFAWSSEGSYHFKSDIGYTHYFPSQGLKLGKKKQQELYRQLHILGSEEITNSDGSFVKNYLDILYRNGGHRIADPSQDSNHFRRVMIYLDYFLLHRYLAVFASTSLLSVDSQIVKSFPTKGSSIRFRLVPLVPDYLFFLFYILNLLLIRWLAPYANRLGFINHAYIYRRLRQLNDTIRAEITLNRQGTVQDGSSSFSFFRFSFGSQKRIPIAGIRQIEEELIEILRLLDRLPKIAVRPEFIFVFDELDKIQGDYSVGIAEKEASELSSFYEEDQLGLQAASQIRQRKQAIERILSNLKRFFSVAQAKFIFIAGREMYDAALADASDRESFISSIFHEVIYVNSFFKDPDNRNLTDITGLTEKYVCQFLLPPGSPYKHDLNGYYKYLLEVLIPNPPGEKKASDQEARRIGAPNPIRIAAEKRKKILYALQHFITYITYRSNGAPKKITKLMEEQVRSVKTKTLNNNARTLMAGRNSKNLYFHFDYLDQYRFGFTNYLFKPFLIAKGRQMRDLSDQMLVSTSFLLDHLFKFHNFGFSWRHLEQTPEIISINKAPELRKFIGEILVFLGDSHLEEIVSGLFQFKFTYKMANEISLISKISELEAAAFNFTLDESLHLKKHYKRKVYEIRAQFQKTVMKSEEFAFINSISLLNVYLGDLYFYDKEFEDAVLHYLEAKQRLRSIYNDKKIDDLQLISVVRLNLRIGLTYEKMKDYESAFMAYGQITRTIRKYALEQDSDNPSSSSKAKKKRKKSNSHDKKLDSNYPKRIIFEYFRLIMQPLLARLHLIEKSSTDRLTQQDLVRTINEAQVIFKMIYTYEKFIVQTEFYNKIGDLLFYKNGQPIHSGQTPYWTPPPLINLPDKLVDDKETSKNNGLRDYKAPIEAYRYYHLSLSIFIQAFERIERQAFVDEEGKKKFSYEDQPFPKKQEGLDTFEMLPHFLNFYKKDYRELAFTSKNKNLLISIATSLSNMGDTLLSSLFCGEQGECNLLDIELLCTLFSTSLSDKGNIKKGMEVVFKTPNQPMGNISIYYFYLSGQFFKRAALYSKYALQLRKILHFLRNLAYCYYGRIKKKDEPDYLFDEGQGTKFLKHLRHHIIREALSINDRAGNFTRRQYLYEYERLTSMGIEHETSQEKLDLFIASRIHIPEVKEMVLLLEDIKLFSAKIHLRLFHPVVNPYAISNHKYVRLLELNFKANLNNTVMRNSQLLTSLYDSVFLIYLERINNGLEKSLKNNFQDWADDKTSFERNADLFTDLINEKRRTIFLKIFEKHDIIHINGTPSSSEKRNEILKFWRSIIGQCNDLPPAGPAEVLDQKLRNVVAALKALKIEVETKLKKQTKGIPELNFVENSSSAQLLIAFWKADYAPVKEELSKVFEEKKIKNISTLQYLISDSLFSLSELVKTSYLFGVSYMINHTFIGNAHAELGGWSKYYHLLRKLEGYLDKKADWDIKSVHNRLKDQVDEHDTHYFDIGYHYKEAEANYYLALEMHNEGVSYQNYVLNHMFFLDDDFNDDLYHFSAAMERYYINSGILRERIIRVKDKAKRVELFDYRYHFDFPDEESKQFALELDGEIT